MFKYTSFISYSRAADSRLAPELKSALQNFAKPWYKLRAIQVFCDQTNLTANPDLWGAIEVSLQSAEYFIYLASPLAAQSKWVKKELEAFAGMRSHNIIIILTDGAILWDDSSNNFDWNTTTAVPTFDKALFLREPTWIDLTWIRKEQLTTRDPRFLDAVANLSSVLRGIDKDVLIGKDVEEHKKVKRFRVLSIVGLSLLALFFMAATVVALLSERRSQQRLVATFESNGNAMLDNGDFVMAIPWYVEAMTNDRNKSHREMHETRVLNFMNAVPQLQQVWHTELPVLKTFFAGSGNVIIITGETVEWGINEFTCFTNNNGICKGKIQLLNRQTGADVFKPIETLDGIRTAAVHPNGKLLATISVANKLRLYNLQSGTLVWELFLVIPPSSAPDGGTIEFDNTTNNLLALTQWKLVVCNISDGKIAGVFPNKDGLVPGKASFLKTNGQVIVSGNGLQLWDYKTNRISKIQLPYMKRIESFVLNSNGTHIAFSGEPPGSFNKGLNQNSVIAVAYIDKMDQPLFTDNFETMGLKMVFSKDGAMLAANGSITTEGGSADFGTRVWSTKSGEAIIPWIKMPYEVNVGFSGKDNEFILTCNDGTTQVFQLPEYGDETFTVYRKLKLHDGNTGQSSIIDSLGNMITVSDQRLVKLWKLPEANNYYQAFAGDAVTGQEQTDTLSWYVVNGNLNDTIRLDSSLALIVDRKSNKPIGKPLKANSEVYETLVSPDGKLIVIKAKGEVSVWSKNNQEKMYTFPVANSSGISTIVFSKDSKKILTGHFDFSSRIWDAASGKALTPFMRHPFSASLNDNLVTSFSPDEKRVITKDYDTYRVWDAVSGQPISPPIKSDYKYEAILDDTTVKNKPVKPINPFEKNLSTDALKLYSELVSGSKIDESGAVISLTEDEYALKWQQWKNLGKH